MIQAVKKATEVTVDKPQKIEHLLTFQDILNMFQNRMLDTS